MVSSAGSGFVYEGICEAIMQASVLHGFGLRGIAVDVGLAALACKLTRSERTVSFPYPSRSLWHSIPPNPIPVPNI